MFKLYKKEEFIVGIYRKFPDEVTALLLFKDGYYYDVIDDIWMDFYEVKNGSAKKLCDLVKIKAPYITKKMAIKYYNLLNKEEYNEHVNSL